MWWVLDTLKNACVARMSYMHNCCGAQGCRAVNRLCSSHVITLQNSVEGKKMRVSDAFVLFTGFIILWICVMFERPEFLKTARDVEDAAEDT